MMGRLRFPTAAITVIALSGALAYRLAAQETPEEPPASEATPELIFPEITSPAPPPMTEEEAARVLGVDEDGAADVLDLTPPDLSAPRSARAYRTCPDREERPAWIEELKGWDSIRGLVISEIYQARVYEKIVATGDCSCANKAPPWDAAEAEYQENYAAISNQGLREVRDEFQTLSGNLYKDARRICRAQGNW
ncbi:hypothetical protein [Rubellimicrobium aerolatum]|uniref:DUF1311 domain-containing protein n=1 Tax=Rubellimicrobium aerolatum TaxID=490979 RepID=A0ABW0SEI5_9RHOB|nr:hypothetical protein [Rubellimicrobium aerolatum]MBP1806900.1 hypothetical protein [Rubellimicrobium aerolatum]